MEFRFVTRNPNVYAKTKEAGLRRKKLDVKMVAKYPESRTDEFVYLCRSKEERRKEKERGEKKEEKVCSHTPI